MSEREREGGGGGGREDTNLLFFLPIRPSLSTRLSGLAPVHLTSPIALVL